MCRTAESKARIALFDHHSYGIVTYERTIADKNENRHCTKEDTPAFFFRKCFCAMDYDRMMYLCVYIHSLPFCPRIWNGQCGRCSSFLGRCSKNSDRD